MRKILIALFILFIVALSTNAQECAYRAITIIEIDTLSSKYFNYGVFLKSDSIINQVWWNRTDDINILEIEGKKTRIKLTLTRGINKVLK